jgi:hypothetical protein
MPGVRLLLRYGIPQFENVAAAGGGRREVGMWLAIADGLNSGGVGSGGHGASCRPALTERVAGGGLKMDAI